MDRAFSFVAGKVGPWRIDHIAPVAGPGLEAAPRLLVQPGFPSGVDGAVWMLRGVTSHERYLHRTEREQLVPNSPPLGRAEATQAALIPIRKTPAWWALAQDERRAIFEEQSDHIKIGLRYLPAVARRLHHSRDLGEPFDFLTWFEYAPKDAGVFEELVAALRASPEWRYVEREVDIRLTRDGASR